MKATLQESRFQEKLKFLLSEHDSGDIVGAKQLAEAAEVAGRPVIAKAATRLAKLYSEIEAECKRKIPDRRLIGEMEDEADRIAGWIEKRAAEK